MTYEEGALLEPLSVAVHACGRSELKPGAHVLITGAGPIGLVTLLVARASGATKIFITGKSFSLNQIWSAEAHVLPRHA